MASSDLLIQSLLGGQQMMDPAVAAFQPKMSLAQAMLQQGTDSSPTTKWGGLSRLASALTGGYLLNQNQEGLQDIATQRAKDAATFSASLGDTLTPPQMATAPQSMNQPGMNIAPAGGLSGAVHQLESGGSMAPGITGDGGAAAGPMQVHQAALDDVNKANGTNYTLAQVSADPNIGKSVGDSYLKLQQARFPGRPDLALAAYNAGPTATANAGGPGVAGVPAAAQGYVDRGMAQVAGPGAPTGGQQPQQPPGGPPQVGASNPYVAKALDTIHRAQAAMIANPYNPQIQKAGQMAIDNAHTMMGMDTFTTNADGTQTNQRTGQMSSAAAPNAHYVQTSTGAVDTTGTHAPTYMPAPRVYTDSHGNTGAVGPGGAITPIASNPSGFTGTTPQADAMRTLAEIGPKMVDGTATPQERANYSVAAQTYQDSKTVTTTPGQTVTQVPTHPLPAGMPSVGSAGVATAPSPVVVAPRPGDISSQAADAARGTEAGRTAVTVPKLASILQSSVQGIGTIDSATSQLNEAAKNGIPTGYFTPALATAAQAAKSLGIDTTSLGVRPEGVSDIAAARKSLALVSGSIIRNILGPDTPITDAKLEQYVHATPGIETDPGALQKILGWARTQVVYEHNMAMDGLRNADPTTGIIPGGWQSGYLAKNGGGPVYDPLSGEMKQPNGKLPSVEPPAAASPQQPAGAPAAYREGQTASGPGGAKMVFTGGHWVAK